MSFNITKLSADEFLVRELKTDSREYTYTGKLHSGTLQTKWYPIILTTDLVRKLLTAKIGDTVIWADVRSLNLTKLSANEFLGREQPDGEERKCVQTGEFLELQGSIFPIYLNPETISRLSQMKVSDTVTLYPVEDSERFIDCPLCGSPMCGATAKEWRIK